MPRRKNAAAQQKQKKETGHASVEASPRPLRFECEFNSDFKSIGIKFDVDDDGRLVVQEVHEQGEARGLFPDLRHGDLVVAVGTVCRQGQAPADELLSQLITLPRPIKVEFARSSAAGVTDAVVPAESASATRPGRGGTNGRVEEHGASSSREEKHSSRPEPKGNDSKTLPKPLPSPPPPSSSATTKRRSAEIAAIEAAAKAHRQKRAGICSTTSDKNEHFEKSDPAHAESERSNTSSTAFTGHERRWAPPRRRGSMIAGANWKETLESGAARIPQHSPPGPGHAKRGSSSSVITVASASSDGSSFTQVVDEKLQSSSATERGVTVKASTRGIGGADGNVAHSPTGSSISSVHRWLQDDTDDSDNEQHRTSSRHSWYTAIRQRGGHAPDIKHTNSISRAAALSRAQSVANAASSAVSAEGSVTTRGAGGISSVTDSALRLPHAVSAGQYPSPKSPRNGANPGQGGKTAGTVASLRKNANGDEAKSGVGTESPGSNKDFAHLHGRTSSSRLGTFPGASTLPSEAHEQPPQGEQQLPTGAVKARHHRSPSQDLSKGGKPNMVLEVAAALGRLAETRDALPDTTTVRSDEGKKNEPESRGEESRLASGDKFEEPATARASTAGEPGPPAHEAAPNRAKKSSSFRGIQKPVPTAVTPGPVSNKDQGATTREGEPARPPQKWNRFDPENVPSPRETHPNRVGSIVAKIQNHVPFSRRKIVHVSSLDTETTDGSTEAPAPVPQPTKRERRPSVGPVNPRAMYGHEAPTAPAAHLTAARRPSSVVMIVSEDDIDKIVSEEKLTSDEHVSTGGEEYFMSGGSGGVAPGISRSRVEALENDSGAERRNQQERQNEGVKGKGGHGGDHGALESSSPSLAGQPSSGDTSDTKGIEKETTLNGRGHSQDAECRRSSARKGSQQSETDRRPQDGTAEIPANQMAFGNSTCQSASGGPVWKSNHHSKIATDRREETDDSRTAELDEKTMLSWEDQLRIMAGMSPSPGAASWRGQQIDKKISLRHSGKQQNNRASPDDSDDCKVTTSKANHGEERLCTAPTLTTPKPMAWNRPRVNVGETPSGWQSTDAARHSRHWGEKGRADHGGGGDDDVREPAVARAGAPSTAEGRRAAARLRLRQRQGGTTAVGRAQEASDASSPRRARRSSSQGPSSSKANIANPMPSGRAGQLNARGKPPQTAASAAAAAAAAAEAVNAAAEGWRRGRSAAAAGRATVFGGGVGAGQRASSGVARVRVKVRSSVYLIVAELKMDGEILMQEVFEAEKLRHGANAAKIIGLTNESTGDNVDMEVPAERSMSAGDSLIAIIEQSPADTTLSETSDVRRSSTLAEPSDSCRGVAAVGTPGDGAAESVTTAGDISATRGDEKQGVESRGATTRAIGATSRSRPIASSKENAALRIDVKDTGRCGGLGSAGHRSRGRSRENPDRSPEVEQLRDEVARRLFIERRAAGEGIGAYSPPTRPPGSPPLTPLTAGGRGASPEHSRPTSPRSASPRGAPKGPGKSGGDGETMKGDNRPPSPARSARSATSGHTHFSGFSMRSHGKPSCGEAAFLAQSILTPEDLDEILKEELVKSRKWSARNRDADDRFRRVWEERGSEYARSQKGFEEAKALREEKMRERQEREAEQMAARMRQRTARAESALQQARSSRGSRDCRAREAEAAHRRRMQDIAERRDRERREHESRVQMLDRRREDVRDTFLDMVDAENETAVLALETPLEMLNRALEEEDSVLEKKARRAILRQTARERLHVRERAAKVLAEQRRQEKTRRSSSLTRQELESSMMPGPGQYDLRDFSEHRGRAVYSQPLA